MLLRQQEGLGQKVKVRQKSRAEGQLARLKDTDHSQRQQTKDRGQKAVARGGKGNRGRLPGWNEAAPSMPLSQPTLVEQPKPALLMDTTTTTNISPTPLQCHLCVVCDSTLVQHHLQALHHQQEQAHWPVLRLSLDLSTLAFSHQAS